MDGAHDMGGMHGFGAIPRERDAAFEADWQRRVFALTEALAPLAGYGPDRHRAAIERIPPARYLASGYFERWLEATTGLLLEAGLIDPDELCDGVPDPSRPVPTGVRPVGADELVAAARAGAAPSAGTGVASPAPFTVGDVVRAAVDASPGHARLPRYVRGRLGTVVHAAGAAVPPDAAADGATDAAPGHVFTVAFAARALWGRDAESPDDLVHVDLWESCLERV